MALGKRYSLRQPWLAETSERSLDPAFAEAVKTGAIEKLVCQPQPGIIEFPLFSPTYAQALLRELQAFEHWCAHQKVRPTRPNSMNQQGVVLDELGLEGAIDELLDTWISPLTSRWFQPHSGGHLDHHHAFIVDYEETGDTDLDLHVDDSEITLNACLGFEFEGAEVYFEGERCAAHRHTPADDAERWEWSPTPGSAILHAGSHRHGVRPLREGRRINLIVWARSTRHRKAKPIQHAAPAEWCRACGDAKPRPLDR